MLLALWNEFLYRPLFNLLIFIYNNWTGMNLGWAVVVLTILLRLALLPFSLLNERNRIRNAVLAGEIADLKKQYHNDPVMLKEEIRGVLKKRKVQPWAKVIVLGIQLLVLVLLYQVFLRGITGEKLLKVLYPSVQYPGVINTRFYGFELGRAQTASWAAVAALWLAAEIYLEFSRRRKLGLGIHKNDLAYFVFFPLAVFGILYALPMVKSLFVLTSFSFSAIIGQFSKLIFRTKA